MKRHVVVTTLWLTTVAAALGCITINLYFPERELRDAAETIVEEARPDDVSVDEIRTEDVGAGTGIEEAPPRPADDPAPQSEQSSISTSAARLCTLTVAWPILGVGQLAEPPQEKKVKIDISTPLIKKIRETLKKRYPKLAPFYEKGALGESLAGYLVERDTDDLNLKEKRTLKTLLKQENDDRKNLYAEIARANDIDPGKTGDIAEIFATQWIEKSNEGWWIETKKGVWERKKKAED